MQKSKPIYFLFFLFMIAMVSCRPNTNDNYDKELSEENIEQEEFTSDANCETQNDSLVARLYNGISIKNLKNNFPPENLKMEFPKNEYDPSKIDTSFLFSADGDSVTVYLAYQKELLIYLNLSTEKIKIIPGLKKGMAKEILNNLLHLQIPNSCGHYIITTLEGDADINFFFENNKLTEVIFETHYFG